MPDHPRPISPLGWALMIGGLTCTFVGAALQVGMLTVLGAVLAMVSLVGEAKP